LTSSSIGTAKAAEWLRAMADELENEAPKPN
jgi:hypothetical protein